MDSRAREPDAQEPPPLSRIGRGLETIRWGERFRDRALIAAYYSLLMANRVGRPGRPVLKEVHPKFWLGDVDAVTPTGRFHCRGRTTDFDIVNPHYEFPLVREVGARLSGAKDHPVVFVDVGAHIGKYAVHAGRILRDRGVVVAVEPDPDNYAALQDNVALNRLENVRPFNVGCWDRDGTLTLHRKRGNLGAHSFVESRGADSIPVPVRPLDSLIREARISQVDLLKIDVELAEERVLRGAREVLCQLSPPTVFFEEHGDPESAGSVRYLRDLGFSVRPVHRITYVAERAG